MKDRDRTDRPAAIPLILFVTGLALAERLVSLSAGVAGSLVVALLAWKLLHSVRLTLIIGLFGAGLIIGARAAGRERALDPVMDADRFASVEIPAESSWTRTANGFRISAYSFRSEGVPINRPITIYLASEPPGLTGQAVLIAEGFLRRTESGRFSLTCKSPLLVRYSGRASHFHPRHWNRRAAEKLGALTQNRPEYGRAAALAKALALGRSDELPPELREDYRRGGTYHLLVFSGMQIALAAAGVSLLFRARGNLRMADWSLLALALFAPLFAGNEPSVTRASLMIGLYSASRILGRPTSLENLFFVSALARLALRPEELTDPGFALTYAATGGLLFIGRPLARLASRRVTAALLYGVGAEMATLPLTLFFFQQYVLCGSIVTLLLAPLLAVMLGLASCACALVFLSTDATFLCLDLLGGLDTIATATNSLFGETLGLSRVAAAPPAMMVIICFALFLLIVSFRARSTRFARSGQAPRGIWAGGVALLLLPVAFSLTTPIRKQVEFPQVEFFYVGQGDSILLRSKGFTLLVDGGGRRQDVEFGRRVLLPKLAERGVAGLDAVMLTHPHPDHCSGLPFVLENFEVGELWLSPSHLREDCANDLANLAFDRRIPVRLIRHGDSFRRGQFDLRFALARTRFKRASLNNSSVVMAAAAQGRGILLTGDIEKEAEAELLEDFTKAEVLKAPHHGSRTSTTLPLLTAVVPRLAVISCGRRNPFGHPHASILERLDSFGVRTLRTDTNGDIRMVLRDGHIFVVPQIDTPEGAP